MGGLTLVTLFFGFNRLISVVGSIGPLLSVLAIMIGVAGVVMNTQGLVEFPAVLKPLTESKTVLQAGGVQSRKILERLIAKERMPQPQLIATSATPA